MTFIFGILNQLINIYFYALLIYILMSWFPQARQTKFGEVLGSICEPYLEIFRRFIPPFGMFDFSPIVALFILRFAQRGLYALMNGFLF